MRNEHCSDLVHALGIVRKQVHQVPAMLAGEKSGRVSIPGSFYRYMPAYLCVWMVLTIPLW